MKIDSAQTLAFDPVQSQTIHANLTQTESLYKAAEQFEAVFLQMVLKNMHAVTDTMAGDHGLFSSKDQQLFRDMYDAQLAQSLASTKQAGLAETIVRQMGDYLAENENKFKQLSDSVASNDQAQIVSPELAVQDYQNSAFAQPLLVPYRTEEYKQ